MKVGNSNGAPEETPAALQERLTAEAGLSAEEARHLAWLLVGTIRTPDGLLYAWLDGERPAFVYPEASGYLLYLLCLWRRAEAWTWPAAHAERIARALLCILGDSTGFGRDGQTYLFDTVICLRALRAWRETFAADAPTEPLERLTRTAVSWLKTRVSIWPPEAAGGHWSASFSPHLLKCLAPLADALGDELPPLVELFVDRFFRDGFFHVDQARTKVYLHAHCYALEGLLTLAPARRAPYAPLLIAAADRLTELQQPDGSLPNRRPSYGDFDYPADAIAQAVRIWQCLDEARYAAPIDAGLMRLAALGDKAGGVRYSTKLPHRNSWATIFALQAWRWRREPARMETII
mgnify:CR=1 FL=1